VAVCSERKKKETGRRLRRGIDEKANQKEKKRARKQRHKGEWSVLLPGITRNKAEKERASVGSI